MAQHPPPPHSTPAPPASAPRRFEFARDTFAFPNELFWEYRIDPAAGTTTFQRREPSPAYAHRCFVLARAARQFFHHARFEPALPAATDDACRRLVRTVLARNPRRHCAPADRVVIPGFANLRSFSAAREALLKATCGGAWRSYVLRSHWRMVFPISRPHQARTAAGLATGIAAGGTPVVHLVRFPQLTINHGIVLFGAAATPTGTRFAAYDPNLPERPAVLDFDLASRTFEFPANSYWAGGRVDVIEIFRNWLY